MPVYRGGGYAQLRGDILLHFSADVVFGQAEPLKLGQLAFDRAAQNACYHLVLGIFRAVADLAVNAGDGIYVIVPDMHK